MWVAELNAAFPCKPSRVCLAPHCPASPSFFPPSSPPPLLIHIARYRGEAKNYSFFLASFFQCCCVCAIKLDQSNVAGSSSLSVSPFRFRRILSLMRSVLAAAICFVLLRSCAYAIRSLPCELSRGPDAAGGADSSYDVRGKFLEAPDYRNGPGCRKSDVDGGGAGSVCDPSLVRIAMTLDFEYLRGTVAAVHSVLRHSSCPDNIFFHFVASASENRESLAGILRSAFPSLRFKIYGFDEGSVRHMISSSVRQALENPLNYARSYLADLLEPCIERVIYLDSDVILADDIRKLWTIPLTGSRVIGAPEYCHANFTKYFSDEFWSDTELPKVFEGKRPCYFNTGVMVMDLVRWREGDYRRRIEGWMEIQRERRIYELGSLPPFLLVFGGDIEAIDRRWNQHGLGGDNMVNSCRKLHPGPVSLLHWSGKGKPWTRLDLKMPCPVDYLWMPYDLHSSKDSSLAAQQL